MCQHFKDMVTSKKVSVNLFNADLKDWDAEPGTSFTMHDEAFDNLHSSEPTMSVAPHSLELQVICLSFSPGINPKCILDSGATVTGDKPQCPWSGHLGNIARKCTIY